jgi:hypothetical protein
VKRHITKAIQQIDHTHNTVTKQKWIAKQQALFEDRQKIGNQIITGQYKGRNSMQLKALQVDTPTIETDPIKVMNIVETYYTEKMLPTQGPNTKTGKYHPLDQPRSYPWEAPMAPDPFTLATAPSTKQVPRTWLHTKLQDTQAFQACLKTLARNKAPGPDGITNEMLNMLPTSGQQMIHLYLQLMWATGYTPQHWKESSTVLLYKNKGTPLHLQYYRRIGLENTLYKLWTRLITWTLADYAETHNLLSYTQGGFRNKRTCMDQLELMTMLLEDAKMHKQDIYLLMIDFSEAFDTIDHDKMLQIMYDLGFPTDAIEVVKNLYSNATTYIHTPYGNTPPIKMERGTIQGDSLSPFLFILYLEPLLRWLRVGARGYVPRTFANETPLHQLQHHTPDITYADDLNLLTTCPKQLQAQAYKVTQFANWGCLHVNSSKTLATGARHKTSPKDPYNATLLKQVLERTTVQGAPATFHDPKHPFRYLGVQFTMNLNWSHHYQHILKIVRDTTTHLSNSYATTAQKMRTLQACIKTKIRYAFSSHPSQTPRLKQWMGS